MTGKPSVETAINPPTSVLPTTRTRLYLPHPSWPAWRFSDQLKP